MKCNASAPHRVAQIHECAHAQHGTSANGLRAGKLPVQAHRKRDRERGRLLHSLIYSYVYIYIYIYIHTHAYIYIYIYIYIGVCVCARMRARVCACDIYTICKIHWIHDTGRDVKDGFCRIRCIWLRIRGCSASDGFLCSEL